MDNKLTNTVENIFITNTLFTTIFVSTVIIKTYIPV